MFVLLSVLNDQFLQVLTFKNIMQQLATVGIVSIGAMVVIISGGIDLSAGYGLAFAGVTGGVFFKMFGDSFPAMLVSALIAGLIIGFANGIIIAKLKIQPFIVTLAMMSICQGLALFVSEGKTILISNPLALFVGQGFVFNFIAFPFIIFIAVSIIGYFLLNKTKLGVYTYALGGNEDAVKLAGVKIDRYKILIYMFAGACFGLASVIMITTIANVTPNLQGSILLDAIASVVIGGTSISGGKGTVLGTFIGVLIIGLISTALTYLNVDPLLRDVVKGSIILVALLFDKLIYQTSKK